MVPRIEIQTHFGIGDALFLTPTLQRIREAYPTAFVQVNTRHLILYQHNPYIDVLGNAQRGTRLMYCDPTSCTGRPGRRPDCHHIVADWRIVSHAYDLRLEAPELRPQVYFKYRRGDGLGPVGVQVDFKGLWHEKKNWPYAAELAGRDGFWPIPQCRDLRRLAEFLTSCRAVVAIEGGISHLCRALDVPCLVVYGGFADPAWNGYEEQINVTNYLDCSPCYSGDPCVKGNKPCMAGITPERVCDVLTDHGLI